MDSKGKPLSLGAPPFFFFPQQTRGQERMLGCEPTGFELLELEAMKNSPVTMGVAEDERCKYCTNEGMCTMRRSICEGCASCTLDRIQSLSECVLGIVRQLAWDQLD